MTSSDLYTKSILESNFIHTTSLEDGAFLCTQLSDFMGSDIKCFKVSVILRLYGKLVTSD